MEPGAGGTKTVVPLGVLSRQEKQRRFLERYGRPTEAQRQEAPSRVRRPLEWPIRSGNPVVSVAHFTT